MSPDHHSIFDELSMLCGAGFQASDVAQALEQSGIALRQISSPAELAGSNAAIVLLDAGLLDVAPMEAWREAAQSEGSGCLVLVEAGISAAGADLVLPAGLGVGDSLKLIQLALTRWTLARENQQLHALLEKTEDDLQQLTEIGIALAAEKDLNRLLDRILAEAQNLACCDAASLFLVESGEEPEAALTFKLTRNDSIQADFKEQRVQLNKSSIAGYVAVTGEALNIANAYEIPDDKPYSFNRDIDHRMGYRTVSLLALPIRNYRNDVIGVLQFINRKTRRGVTLDSPETALSETLPFEEGQIKILTGLAGQSAVALENSMLLESINKLFSGFVQAAVGAIEQRDPTTSGHSFRVADLTTELAIKLPQARIPAYRDVSFGEEEITELRYAALLHDFGKVGVREHVLVKAKKLPEGQFEIIRYRIRLAQESLRRELNEQLLHAVKAGAPSTQIDAIQASAEQGLVRLEQYLDAIARANEPTVLDDGSFEHLGEIRDYSFSLEDEGLDSLLSEEEYNRLAIRRGSLSQQERAEIESHVVHTTNFLRLIPWTPELSRIPDLAQAHHEKLDGTGYPLGMHAEDIPLGSKMMTICDIYDALTASDRPYKSAVSRDVAYDILNREAAQGKIDASLVNLFIDAEIFKVIEGKDYGSASGIAGLSNHPCAPETHIH